MVVTAVQNLTARLEMLVRRMELVRPFPFLCLPEGRRLGIAAPSPAVETPLLAKIARSRRCLTTSLVRCSPTLQDGHHRTQSHGTRPSTAVAGWPPGVSHKSSLAGETTLPGGLVPLSGSMHSPFPGQFSRNGCVPDLVTAVSDPVGGRPSATTTDVATMLRGIASGSRDQHGGSAGGAPADDAARGGGEDNGLAQIYNLAPSGGSVSNTGNA